MNVEMIFAVDRNGGIGKDGRLPWPHCKADMKRFMDLTKDTICVMGRRTYNDIYAAAKEKKRSDKDIKKKGLLKGRECIVLSSTEDKFDGAVGMKTLRDVFNAYRFTDKRVVVIGGEKLFIQAATWANTVHVSVFENAYSCDRFLPLSAMLDRDFTTTDNATEHSQELGCNVYFLTLSRRDPLNYSR